MTRIGLLRGPRVLAALRLAFADEELLQSVAKATGKRWKEKVKETKPEDDPLPQGEDTCSPAREKPPPPPSNKMPAKKEPQEEGYIQLYSMIYMYIYTRIYFHTLLFPTYFATYK